MQTESYFLPMDIPHYKCTPCTLYVATPCQMLTTMMFSHESTISMSITSFFNSTRKTYIWLIVQWTLSLHVNLKAEDRFDSDIDAPFIIGNEHFQTNRDNTFHSVQSSLALFVLVSGMHHQNPFSRIHISLPLGQIY